MYVSNYTKIWLFKLLYGLYVTCCFSAKTITLPVHTSFPYHVPQDIPDDFIGLPIGVRCNYVRYLPKIELAPFYGKSLQGKSIKLSISYLIVIPLERLIAHAKADGITLEVSSGYRNWREQSILYQKVGATQAEKPGYSEHHIGTTVDFRKVGAKSKTFFWLLQHGIHLGWIPTYYFRNENLIRREPWHWRYVGKKAANKFYKTWYSAIQSEITQLGTYYNTQPDY